MKKLDEISRLKEELQDQKEKYELLKNTQNYERVRNEIDVGMSKYDENQYGEEYGEKR